MNYFINYLNSKYLIPVSVVVIVLVLGAGGFLYFKSRSAPVPNNPQAAQAEVKKLVVEVSKLIDLPTGEDPTVATVTDISKLKDQPFFQKAKNGDKVLIYTNARKAILYDPNVKKVIDVAPINIGSNSAQQAPLVPKIALKNGTSVVGLTSKVEAEVKKVVPDINVIDKDNAKKAYDKTIVVVLNNNFIDYGNNLVNYLKGASLETTLPEGEQAPKDAEILIILGKDRSNGI